MEKWEIRPTPSADDPDRHLLLLQGGPSDVAALLKKFGALMGRPSPAQEQGFNLSLVLHRLKPEKRAKLDAWLTAAAPPAAASPAASAPPPVPAPTPNPAPPVPTPDLAPPVPMPELKPPVPMPELTPPVPTPVGPPAIPALQPPEPEKPALVSLTPEPAKATPPPPAPEPVPALAPAPAAPVPAPVSIPPPPPGAAGYALTVDLQSDLTMETLLVGAYNRFAHAAAMSVVTSPGSMYNPLFLYGVPGTGKSHMLNAIGAALSKGLGGAVLMNTSGSRLSRALNVALARKSMAELDAKIAGSKAFLIDDIHLMAVTDQNKDALAKIFKSFFDRQQQVVITSLYPPRALATLEEALKFSFSKGWSVDLKVPSPTVQKDLIASAADRSGSGFGNDELALLHEKLSVWGYQDLVQWLRRFAAFKKKREAAGQPAGLQQLMPLIYDPLMSGGAEAPKPASTKFTPPPTTAASEPIAVITPKGQEGTGAFVASVFYEVGAKNGFPQAYRHAVWETYDPTAPFGVPFMIGEICARAAVTRALIVGPAPDSPLGPRAAEFAHATRRILESFGVEMGWIPFNGLSLAAHYVNVHLDFNRLPPKS